MSKTKTAEAPAQEPAAMKSEAAASATGAPSYDLEALLQETGIRSTSTPAMSPPDDVTAVTEDQAITAWHNSKKITAMWCNSSSRNAYAAVSGLGWRKIEDTNDSAFLSLVMLASHAETLNSTVNVNIGADNKIHEIYVW